MKIPPNVRVVCDCPFPSQYAVDLEHGGYTIYIAAGEDPDAALARALEAIARYGKLVAEA